MTETIYTRVKNFIEANSLIAKGDRVLLSLSAGKDSMALLDVTLKLKDELALELGVFHLNHLMRGHESDLDEEFVIAKARSHNLSVFAEKHDFGDLPAGESFENFARQKRYGLLNAIAAQHGYTKIATAHNSNDNAETIIMRIFKGTSLHGLQGIKMMNGNVVRPLLFLSKDEIYAHLNANNLSWREDASNCDNKYLRNYIRNVLVPQIDEQFPAAQDSLLNLAQSATAHIGLLDKFLPDKYASAAQKTGAGAQIFFEDIIADRSLFDYVLANAIREHCSEYVNASLLNEVWKKIHVNKTNINLYETNKIIINKALCDGKGVINITGKESAEQTGDWEYLVQPALQEARFRINEIERDVYVQLVDFDYYEKNKHGNEFVFMSLDSVSGNILQIKIRNRRTGDRIKLTSGTKKIKELMIDAKLDGITKSKIPLIEIESQIAAYMAQALSVHNNKVSTDFYVTEASKKILAIHIE